MGIATRETKLKEIDGVQVYGHSHPQSVYLSVP